MIEVTGYRPSQSPISGEVFLLVDITKFFINRNILSQSPISGEVFLPDIDNPKQFEVDDEGLNPLSAGKFSYGS